MDVNLPQVLHYHLFDWLCDHGKSANGNSLSLLKTPVWESAMTSRLLQLLERSGSDVQRYLKPASSVRVVVLSDGIFGCRINPLSIDPSITRGGYVRPEAERDHEQNLKACSAVLVTDTVRNGRRCSH